MAMDMLKAKLYAKRLAEENEEKKQLYSQQSDVAWGSQIRNYVLHPYNMVKDNRSNYQTSNVQSVLDGYGLQSFMQASLMHDKATRQSNN
jgi:peptide chain release factor 2